MKKILKSIFLLFGVEIRKTSNAPFSSSSKIVFPGTMQEGLKRAKKRGFQPATVIDLGAAKGTWSSMSMKLWPNAQYVLFEPLVERKKELQQLQSSSNNTHIIYAAAGSEKGTVDFSVTDDLDGSGVYEKHHSAKLRVIEVRTIDEEVQRIGLKPPFMIKFDTHGFETPILEGAKKTLESTELIVMECYGFSISSKALMLHEMCAHLAMLGFRMADIVDVMRRPGDELFWQCDVFFLRASDKSFEQITYAP